jgi:hypothetical protein
LAGTDQGWKATFAFGGGLSASGFYVVDPADEIAYDQFVLGSTTIAEYAVAATGRYEYLGDRASRSAVTMIGRPAVRYVVTSRPFTFSTYVKAETPSPDAVLTEDVDHAGSKTVHDDGSSAYQYTDEDGEAVTVHVDPAGVLTAVTAADRTFHSSIDWTYEPQHLTAPAASMTIDQKTLSHAMAYLNMPASVKEVANESAADTRRAAHGHTVKTASLRKIARNDAADLNSAVQIAMVKVSNVRGGVRVSADNPWTHKTVAYTVKAAGKKVVVKKQ